jgi:hypothetical protein
MQRPIPLVMIYSSEVHIAKLGEWDISIKFILVFNREIRQLAFFAKPSRRESVLVVFKKLHRISKRGNITLEQHNPFIWTN